MFDFSDLSSVSNLGIFRVSECLSSELSICGTFSLSLYLIPSSKSAVVLPCWAYLLGVALGIPVIDLWLNGVSYIASFVMSLLAA